MLCLRCGVPVGDVVTLCDACKKIANEKPQAKRTPENSLAASASTEAPETEVPEQDVSPPDSDPDCEDIEAEELFDAEPLEIAGFWLRGFAMLIDGSIVWSVALMIVVGLRDRLPWFREQLVSSIVPHVLNFEPAQRQFIFTILSDEAATIAVVTVSLLFGLIYFSLMEASPVAGSLGKLAFQLTVVTQDGERVFFFRALLRNGLKLVSAVCFGLGFLIAILPPHKQALHDLLSASIVIKRGTVSLGQVAVISIAAISLVIGVSYLGTRYLILASNEPVVSQSVVSNLRQSHVRVVLW